MDQLTKQFKKKKNPERAQPARANTSFKFALATGVFLALGAIFYVWPTFGDTTIGVKLIDTLTRTKSLIWFVEDSHLNSDLVAHWTLDDADLVDNAVDRSGNGNTGYLTNISATTTITSIIGEALSFDGSDDHVVTTASIAATQWTIAAWVNPNSGAFNGFDERLFSQDSFAGIDVAFEITTGDFEWFDGSWHVTDLAIPKEEWTFVALTYDGTEVTPYKNDTTGSAVTTGRAMTGVSYIGHSQDLASGRAFDGYIDDFRVYDRALSVHEISRLYQLGGRTYSNTAITSPDLQRGLVGHWSFDGKYLVNNVADTSGQGNTGYLTNFTSTTTTIGILGQALEFDGTDDHVDISNESNFDFERTDPFSISMWFYPETNNSIDVMAKWGGKGWLLNKLFGGKVSMQLANSYNSNAIRVSSDPTVNLNAWNHVVVTYDGSSAASGILLYFDGQSISTTITHDALSATILHDTVVKIGEFQEHGHLNGTIDDVRVYDRTLSADEAARLYELGATTHVNTTITSPNLERGLVGHWSFDGKNLINNATDTSGQGNTGYLTNFTSTTTVPGILGQALDFDGSDDYVGVDESWDDSGFSEMTVSVWANLDSASGTYYMMTNTNFVSDTYIIMNYVNGSFEFMLTESTGNSDRIGQRQTATNSADQWYHLVGVWDGGAECSSITLYVDGELEASDDSNSCFATFSGTYSGSSGELQIGNYTFGSAFPGSLDDVRVYDRALSAEEVSRLYELGR